MFPAATLVEPERQAETCVRSLTPAPFRGLEVCGLIVCVATTGVHEYGKPSIESVLARINVGFVDGGVVSSATQPVATSPPVDQFRIDRL